MSQITTNLRANINYYIDLELDLNNIIDIEAKSTINIDLQATIEDLILGIFLLAEDDDNLLFEDNFKIIL